MIYPNELARYKTTNFMHPTGLQTFNTPPPPPLRNRQMKARIIEQMSKFNKSSIHGSQYIWKTETRKTVHLFWLLITMSAIVGCITMYFMLTQRHGEQVLMTVVETSRLPIYFIRFPAVAVCPYNHVNWVRYKAAEEKFLPHNADEGAKRAFYELLLLLDEITFTRLTPIEAFLRRSSIPPVIQNLVLYDLAQFMAFRCDELFVRCNYDETTVDCCKIFVMERTERGICLVFNSLISEESRMKKFSDNLYPWRIRDAGEGTGLKFLLRFNKTLYRPGDETPFAFSISIKESEEWSDTLHHILYPNTYNDLMIKPIITETSANTRSLDPQIRNCLFSAEKSQKYNRIYGLPFNKRNCQTQCEQKFVMQHCNCTLSLYLPGMPKYPNRECKVSDLECFHKHKDIFNYIKGPHQDEYINDTRRGMVCDCIDNCMSLIYLVSLNTQQLPDNGIPEAWANIYFGQKTMTKYVARLKYTKMDLLANFGGAMGLCLGASVLSIAEIIYAIIRTTLVLMVLKWNRRRKLHRVQLVKSFNATKD